MAREHFDHVYRKGVAFGEGARGGVGRPTDRTPKPVRYECMMSCRVQHTAFTHGGERLPLMRVKEVVQSDAHRHIAKRHVRHDDYSGNKLHFFYGAQNYYATSLHIVHM